VITADQIPWGGAEDVQTPSLVAFSLDELRTHRFPERRVVLARGDTPILRAGHLGQIHAERGLGKTWLLQTLALVMADGSHALGFNAPQPVRVVYVDGEMDSREIQERFAMLRNLLQVRSNATLTIVAADWQEAYLPRVDTAIGQALVEPFVDNADVVIFDNRSCLVDPEGEKDAAAWQPMQDYLLSLRRRGKAVLMAHHSNRMGSARGHSKAEDLLNLDIKLSRPDGYTQDQGARFEVTFDKSRGAHGAAVAPFIAHLTSDGWRSDSTKDAAGPNAAEKIREYLRLAHSADERPKSANQAIQRAKVGRNAGLEAWASMLGAGVIQKHPEGGFYAA
jgi:hypothetical protein